MQYANPAHAAHRDTYYVCAWGVDGERASAAEVLRRVTELRTADFADCTREVHYAAQIAINDICERGSYAAAVNMVRNASARWA